MSKDSDLDELDIMFLWSEDDQLCIILQTEDGDILEYEFDEKETIALLEFLSEKYANFSKTAKVIGTLADNKHKKKK